MTPDEIEAETGVARKGPGGVARENIDFSRLQGGEALLRGERRVAKFFLASPNSAAATARHKSTSMPRHSPLLSGWAKPARPVLTPHLNEALFERAIGGGSGLGTGDAQDKEQCKSSLQVVISRWSWSSFLLVGEGLSLLRPELNTLGQLLTAIRLRL